MVHVYKDQRGKDRMAARAVPAKIIGYTKTHGTYQVISRSGKRTIAKNPKPTNKEKEDEETEDNFEWSIKPIQDLEDIADGKTGQNYDWHCPIKEECPEETHAEDQTEESQPPNQTSVSPEPDSPSQQLFRNKIQNLRLLRKNCLQLNPVDPNAWEETPPTGRTASSKG